ncbi:MAG: trimeric intracellular cation channel family protein [Sphingobium sp.]
MAITGLADVQLSVGTVLAIIGVTGTFVFAASGAVAAANLRQTLVTFCFFALTTGVGGGTVRDLLIGAPVFWLHNVSDASICLGTALLVWITPGKYWSLRALDWLDAVGLAAYAVIGTAKAMDYGIHPFLASMMGVCTACVGGIIRDLLAGRPSILLRPEIYVTAAALTAGLYATLVTLGVSPIIAGPATALGGFALRAFAIVKGTALPAYRGTIG